MKKKLVLNIVVILLSCNQKNDFKINKLEVKQNENVIHSDKKHLFEMGDSLMFEFSKEELHQIKSSELNTKSDTVTFFKDSIYVSVLYLDNACSESVNNIEYLNDTIFVKTDRTSDVACTSSSMLRLRFSIKNSANKKYFIKKK